MIRLRPPLSQGGEKERSRASMGFSRWAVTGSNRRPPACKAGALPAELTARALQSTSAAERGLAALGRCGSLTDRIATKSSWLRGASRTSSRRLPAELTARVPAGYIRPERT